MDDRKKLFQVFYTIFVYKSIDFQPAGILAFKEKGGPLLKPQYKGKYLLLYKKKYILYSRNFSASVNR